MNKERFVFRVEADVSGSSCITLEVFANNIAEAVTALALRPNSHGWIDTDHDLAITKIHHFDCDALDMGEEE